MKIWGIVRFDRAETTIVSRSIAHGYIVYSVMV
jgi:hypothetical protein